MSYFYTGTPNWVFSLFAFIGFLCSAIPLPWHLEAWNTGTCLYMLWTALACLVFFVDSIVWSGNTIDWAPVWCDISTHFLNGFNLAIPACSLCINRRLYQIASVRSVRKSKAEKRRAILIDLAIGLGLPLLQIPLQYIVQGHRYNIFEDIGCLGETFETPVAVVLFHLPPILLGLISAVYCTLSIRAFHRSRAQFKELLSSNTNLNLNRYARLMALAATDLLLTIPLSVWVLYVNAAVVGLAPWVSWGDTHSDFSRVVQVPGVFWRADAYTAASVETTRWATVACALLFFAFFGFADEARKNYRGFARRVGYTHASMGSGLGSSNGASSAGRNPTLPVFIRKETAQKRDRDSFDSFSDLSATDVSRSYGVGVLDYADAEKGVEYADAEKGGEYADAEKGLTLSLGDVGGMVPDYKEGDYSASSDGSSPISSPTSPTSTDSPTDSPSTTTDSDSDSSRPATPAHAHEAEDAHAHEAEEDDIEVSSLRASVYLAPPPPSLPRLPSLPSLPEAARTHSRSSRGVDVPMRVRDGDVADVV
ncbi:pheromone A receptor-domain-containing protein [Mycena vitilis]|nr:pheromone A receptor-domain-containing protein [Mycena vitilis]